MRMNPRASIFPWLTLLLLGCASQTLPASKKQPGAETVSTTEQHVARGGRLFDKWTREVRPREFKADSKATPDQMDGKGGPNRNGTLNDASGKPLANTGHSYRLKSFFGWDLRGQAGIAGKAYQDKPHTLPINLLTDNRTPNELRDWLTHGGDGLPAYGTVLDEGALSALVAFIIAQREHRLPRAEDIWKLSADAPKHYTLLPDADIARGRDFIQNACSRCHGDDGTQLSLGHRHSLGSFSRAKAYEAWLKIVSGHPGSRMGPQLPPGTTPDAQVATLLNGLAALCDRQQYPPKVPGSDVPDSDMRCGSYLR